MRAKYTRAAIRQWLNQLSDAGVVQSWTEPGEDAGKWTITGTFDRVELTTIEAYKWAKRLLLAHKETTDNTPKEWGPARQAYERGLLMTEAEAKAAVKALKETT